MRRTQGKSRVHLRDGSAWSCIFFGFAQLEKFASGGSDGSIKLWSLSTEDLDTPEQLKIEGKRRKTNVSVTPVKVPFLICGGSLFSMQQSHSMDIPAPCLP